jgi:Cu/Ag efflux protein CusF
MNITTVTFALLLLAASNLAPAATETAKPPAASVAADTAAMSEGEVRKIDKDAKKITLKHGEIKNLGMPPMTMVFQVKDSALLGKVKAGDKVKFSAEKTGNRLAVTTIEVAK